MDFFKPISQTVIDGITRKECIPVMTVRTENESLFDTEIVHDNTTVAVDDNNGVMINWAFPSQVVIAEDYVIEEVITPRILNGYLNKHFLHPKLKPYLHGPLRRILGIESVSSQHLIDIGKAIASEVKGTIENNHLKKSEISFEKFACWVAKWLCCIYRCLERERDCSDESLQKIAEINIFPLCNQTLSSVHDETVFLPLKDARNKERSKPSNVEYKLLLT